MSDKVNNNVYPLPISEQGKSSEYYKKKWAKENISTRTSKYDIFTPIPKPKKSLFNFFKKWKSNK